MPYISGDWAEAAVPQAPTSNSASQRVSFLTGNLLADRLRKSCGLRKLTGLYAFHLWHDRDRSVTASTILRVKSKRERSHAAGFLPRPPQTPSNPQAFPHRRHDREESSTGCTN